LFIKQVCWGLERGGKLVGEFKENKAWNVTEFDKDGNIIEMWVNGKSYHKNGTFILKIVNGKIVVN